MIRTIRINSKLETLPWVVRLEPALGPSDAGRWTAQTCAAAAAAKTAGGPRLPRCLEATAGAAAWPAVGRLSLW